MLNSNGTPDSATQIIYMLIDTVINLSKLRNLVANVIALLLGSTITNFRYYDLKPILIQGILISLLLLAYLSIQNSTKRLHRKIKKIIMDHKVESLTLKTDGLSNP